MSGDRTPIVLPKWGQNMIEGTVSAWHKQVGDQVSEGEEIAEISTDKLDSALESPATGTLVEITVGVGEDAEVGDAIGYIETS